MFDLLIACKDLQVSKYLLPSKSLFIHPTTFDRLFLVNLIDPDNKNTKSSRLLQHQPDLFI